VSRVVIVLDGATVEARLKWAQKLIDATCWLALPRRRGDVREGRPERPPPVGSAPRGEVSLRWRVASCRVRQLGQVVVMTPGSPIGL
jgi:hypothetical protein